MIVALVEDGAGGRVTRIGTAGAGTLPEAEGTMVPRYYFDIHDGAVVIDTDGRELPDRAAARDEALARVAAFAAEPKKLGGGGGVVVTVRDGPENVLMRLRLVCQIEDPAD